MAACVGKVMFYPTLAAHIQRLSRDDLMFEAQALATCKQCPVIFRCRDWALKDPDPAFDHVAGGLTPKQRWAIRSSQT
jgi:hypothetical protein